MSRRSTHIVLSFLLACTSCAEQNQRGVLDYYLPGIQLGESIAQARQRLGTLAFPSGGPFFEAELDPPRDGFSRVILIDKRLDWERQPPAGATIERLELVATGAVAAASAEHRIRHLTRKTPAEGCVLNSEGKPRDRILKWELDTDKSVVLIIPFERTGLDAGTRRDVRLLFYRDASLEDVISGFGGQKPCTSFQ